MTERITKEFYIRDVLEVAHDLIGMRFVRIMPDGGSVRYIVSETEAYRGFEDLACHASKGLTERNRVMFEEGGVLYMYLIYGMYWMMNVVTGKEGDPQAVLIRGFKEIYGPGRLTRQLELNASFYGEDLTTSDRVWFEAGNESCPVATAPRIGIDYAGDPWKDVPWRFFMSS